MAKLLETRTNGAHSPTLLAKNLIDGEERAALSGRALESRSAGNHSDLVAIAPESWFVARRMKISCGLILPNSQ